MVGEISFSASVSSYDQPAIRLASKHCNCALDFAIIVNTSRTDFDRVGRGGGLDPPQ